MIQELTAQDRGEHRERLFVWEVAPEIKKQEINLGHGHGSGLSLFLILKEHILKCKS